MAAGASGSLIDCRWAPFVVETAYWAVLRPRPGQPADGVQRCTAGFLISNFRISNGYSVSVSIQTPVALDIAQDYDPWSKCLSRRSDRGNARPI